MGQGAGAPVGLAPSGEGVGAGQSRGDGHSPSGRHRRRGGKKKVDAAALLDSEGVPGTSTAPEVALQLREGNERVRPTRI
jgi:hypothetical protein